MGNETAKHTPTPWTVTHDPANPNPRIMSSTELIVVVSRGIHFARETEANATFIVRACNSHEALLEAVTNYFNRVDAHLGGDFDDVSEPLRAAIAKAKRGE